MTLGLLSQYCFDTELDRMSRLCCLWLDKKCFIVVISDLYFFVKQTLSLSYMTGTISR